jgi:hypothetical protein
VRNLHPHRCAATLLAATYLVVGIGGDSLYYLLESPSLNQLSGAQLSGPQLPGVQLPGDNPPNGKVHQHGYFHQHGDGLWHRHTAHSVDVPKASIQGRQLGHRTDEPSLRAERSPRHDHTCLLLAAASALAQSLLAGPPRVENTDPGPRIGRGIEALVAPSEATSLGARGPPRTDRATPQRSRLRA